MPDLLTGELPDGWEITTLGEVCLRGGGSIQTGPFGSQLHASDYVMHGVPSVMPTNIGENRIVESGIVRITEADAERLSRHRLRPGDIIYSRRGDVEKRALVRNEQEGWLCGTGCIKVRLGSGIVDPLFTSLYLGHPIVKEWIVRHAIGATMPNLNTSIMSAVPVAVPPLPEQRAIAAILGALDDKIELNRRMNETLEELARTIFKSWFVDFDSVKAKAEGRQPEGMDAEPRTHSVEELVSLGVLVVGDGYRAKNSELAPEGLPFIRAGNLKSRVDVLGAERLCRQSSRSAGVKCSRALDTAFTSKGTVGRITLVYSQTPEFVYSPQVCFWRSANHSKINPHVLYEWMRSPEFTAQVDAVKGNTDMAEYVSLRDQRKMRVPHWSEELHAALGAVLAPLHDRVGANFAENDTLAEIRDLLLPKLISGELRVPDAEKLAEAAS